MDNPMSVPPFADLNNLKRCSHLPSVKTCDSYSSITACSLRGCDEDWPKNPPEHRLYFPVVSVNIYSD